MIKKSLLTLSIIATYFVAVAQNYPLAKHIPASANVVANIDFVRMLAKVPATTLQENSIIQQMMKSEGRSPIPALLKNIQQSGLDLSNGVTIVVRISPAKTYRRPKSSVNLLIKLKDEVAFSNTIKDLMKGKEEEAGEIKTYGTDKILSLDEKTTLGWNNKLMVLVAGYTPELAAELEQYEFDYSAADTVMMADTMATVDTTIKISTDGENFYRELDAKLKKAQRDLCFDLLGGQLPDNLSKNIAFTSLMNTPGDIRIWGSGDNALDPTGGKLPFLKPLLEKLKTIQGKNKSTIINFDNGKIVAVSRGEQSEAVMNVYKKYPAIPQNTSLIKRLPQGKVLGLASITFNPAMREEMMKATGLNELLSEFKGDLPFDPRQLEGVFKPTFMVAVLQSEGNESGGGGPGVIAPPNVIIAMPIADKAKLEQLKAPILEAMESLKGKSEKLKPYAMYDDEVLVISLSPATAKDFLANKGWNTVPAWVQSKIDYPVLVNINFRDILKMTLSKKDNEEKEGKTEKVNELINKFNDILVYGGKLENNTITSTMEFRFSNENENALKQFLDIIGVLSQRKTAFREDESEAEKAEVTTEGPGEKTDSLKMPPPGVDMKPVTLPMPPKFNDPEVQDFANQYIELMQAYLYTMKSEDTEKMIGLSEQAKKFAEKATQVTQKLAASPAEAKKLSDWITEASSEFSKQMSAAVATDPIKKEEEKKKSNSKPVNKSKKN